MKQLEIEEGTYNLDQIPTENSSNGLMWQCDEYNIRLKRVDGKLTITIDLITYDEEEDEFIQEVVQSSEFRAIIEKYDPIMNTKKGIKHLKNFKILA